MDYKTFLDLVLAMENKPTRQVMTTRSRLWSLHFGVIVRVGCFARRKSFFNEVT